jgi:putative endopeptidase
MLKNVSRLLTLAVCAGVVACAHKKLPPPPPPEPPPGPKILQRTLADVGLDANALDRTADPCTDFYQFACGGWLKTTQIPPDKSRWGRSFNEIRERNRVVLHDILGAAQQAQQPDEVTKKIGQYYGSCMNEALIETSGTQAIDGLLKVARSVKDNKGTLQKALVEFHRVHIPVLFDLDSGQDYADATKMIAQLDQAGLGLPDRDYYLAEGDREKKIREAYLGHVERMMVLGGEKPAEAAKAAKEIVAFETQIAKLSQTRVERRDPKNIYHKIDLAGVKKATPIIAWVGLFKALGHPEINDISVNSEPFFKGLNKLIATTKPATWHHYLTWHALHSLAPTLSNDFVQENFSFTKVLTGQEQIEDRWKRCVDSTDAALGELLAQPFVKQQFSGDSKSATQTMVKEIRDAFGRNLTALDWMDEPTRKRAAEKLDAVSFLIGYPDKWKEYNFDVDPKNFAGNVLASRAFEVQRSLNKIGKPVDRGEWDMTPPTVNAYYNPQKNQMVFPAGILQPPFYSAAADVAVNMGGMGMVVGHELTHGFDDEGAQFDAQGNFRDWWEKAVSEKFTAKGTCIADQYSKYEPLPGVPLNGKLTEGENIADNGGVKLAFNAYRNMRAGTMDKIVADGFNEDQQFFLAVGQTWCSLARPEEAARLVKVDPHSPPRFRVMGSLSNTAAFSEAFQCKPGTPMHPTNMCAVW